MKSGIKLSISKPDERIIISIRDGENGEFRNNMRAYREIMIIITL